jgi:hypothetical protein
MNFWSRPLSEPKAKARFSLSPNSVSRSLMRLVGMTSVYIGYKLVSMFESTLIVLDSVSMVMRTTAIYKIFEYIYNDLRCSIVYAYLMQLLSFRAVSP